MALQERIKSRARELRDETAECLSALVRTPSLSGHEAEVIGRIGDFLNDAGCGAVRVDDLGNLIATIGVDDLVIIHSPDATLICKKSEATGIKEMVDKVHEEYGDTYA